jgi:hypothetical protein
MANSTISASSVRPADGIRTHTVRVDAIVSRTPYL